MLKSMTGFGRGEGPTTLGYLVVEMRSVNHRYCDVAIKLPKRLASLESRIRETVRSGVNRGKVDVAVRLDSTGEGRLRLEVDLEMAEQYVKALETLKNHFNLRDEITLPLLASARDLITGKEEQEDVECYWQELKPILLQSMKSMDEMKRIEGETLCRDIRKRMESIVIELRSIKEEFRSRFDEFRNRLLERLKVILRDLELDQSRFHQEVAFLAERADITEEIIRTESHLEQFSDLLMSDEPCGRKLEFLVQEIHREVNTISSKANDAIISQRVVEIKSELEKIREQVQNLE